MTAKILQRRVLVVDDDTDLAETLAERLGELGYDAIAIDDPRRAARVLREEPWDALVTDLRMPEVDGLDLLGVAREVAPERPVLVMTAFSAVESAIECIRRGAFHYFTKPFRAEELGLFLGRAFAAVELAASRDALQAELARSRSLPGLVGQSAALEPVWTVLSRVAETAVPVLLTGETGTGKTAVARALHEESGRRGRFVTVSCSALPEALLESELFGHLRGAFTGATQARGGLFDEAQGGTIFLDEIGELAIGLQAKLLDVLERGVRRAVGSDRETPTDARVVAATHRDLRARVVEGSFREDLLYRLDVVTVELPPLRQRRDDIPALVDRFIARARTKHPKTTATRCAPEALRWLCDNPWPGNVRELEHAVERGVLLARGEEITREVLPRSFEGSAPAVSSASFAGDVMPMRAMQRRYAEWALERLEGRKMLACERLGVDPKTLKRLLSEGDEEGLFPGVRSWLGKFPNRPPRAAAGSRGFPERSSRIGTGASLARRVLRGRSMRLSLALSLQVFGALLSVSSTASAEPSSASSISLADALVRAESHSAEVLLARERLVREQAEIGALGALWKPSVSAFAAVIAATVNNSTATTLSAGGVEFPRIGATRISDEPSFRPSASSIVGVSGRQLIADFGRTSLLRESAEARLPVESARADLARLDARGEAADAFFAELAAEAITKVTEAAVERARARRELVLANAAAGMFPPATKTLAEAELARFELTHRRALGAAKAARIVLAAAVVSERSELAAAEPGGDALTPLPSEDTLTRQALEQHPTLRAARAEIVARHAAVRATGALARPTLFVTAGVTGRAGGATPSAGPELPGEGFVPLMPNYHAGIVLAGPLYDPTVAARREIASAEEGIARRALEAARIRIVTRALRARTDVELADGQIDALGRTRDAAVKNFEQADARFRAGLGSAVELADAESRRVEAEIQLAAGVYDRLRARAALERAIGAPLGHVPPPVTNAGTKELRP